MVKFYVMKIKDGVITIEDVPDLWKAKVEKALKEEKQRGVACKESWSTSVRSSCLLCYRVCGMAFEKSEERSRCEQQRDNVASASSAYKKNIMRNGQREVT